MSVKVMSWVFDHSKATGSDFVVLLVLADHANDNHWACWPSLARIAHKARVGERTARRCLRSLEELGELRTEVSPGRNHTNHYTVVMDGGQIDPFCEKGANPTEKGASETPKPDTGAPRTISEPLEPPLSVRAVENQPTQTPPTDIVHWIESECTRLQIRPGFQSSNTKAKCALRDADSPSLRMEIGALLTEMAYHNRNITSLVAGLLPSQGKAYPAHRFKPATGSGPPERRFERPAKESIKSRMSRIYEGIDFKGIAEEEAKRARK